MAVCRLGENSDVYVYQSVEGGFDCGGCILGRNNFNAADENAILEHLKEHRAAGHKVPNEAFRELGADFKP
ncbi:MAG TPA: hypothetical protein VGG10_05160 [Rhizomicrobium sp.]|jgi:hypothetical protein